MSDVRSHKDGTFAERLAELATALKFEELPPDVVAKMKLLTLDQIGLQVRGSRLGHVQPQRKLVEALDAKAEAQVAGIELRTSMAYAAYLNGTFGHSMEYDDCHLQCWHAGSVIVPAGLAVGQHMHSSGRDLLTALVSGHQVMSTVGTVTTPGMMNLGWHAPKAIGGFAAAAVASRLLGHTSALLAQAFAVAGSDASGPMEYDQTGGEVKRLHAGSGARAGVEAALLAMHGLTGPLTIFEGPRGVFALFGETNRPVDIEALWSTWHVLDTMFRLNPGVGTVLPALDVVTDLQAAHSFTWEQVDDIEVGVREFVLSHGAHIVHPTDSLSAHFSMAFALALRIVTGGSSVEAYIDPDAWADPGISKVSDLVRPVAFDFDESMPLLSAKVTVRLVDGQVLTGEQGGFHGSAHRPASTKEIVAKFRANVANVLSATEAAELQRLIENLEDVPDVSAIASMLCPART